MSPENVALEAAKMQIDNLLHGIVSGLYGEALTEREQYNLELDIRKAKRRLKIASTSDQIAEAVSQANTLADKICEQFNIRGAFSA